MRFLVTFLIVALAEAARAQPIDLAPADAFTDALEAYSSAPFGEEITIAFTREGQTWRDRIRARVAPGAEEGGAVAARFDLGTLHIHARAGDATAIDDRNPAAFARLRIPGPLTPEALSIAFRPIPLPGWELASRGVPDLARPLAFTGPVLWVSAALDPDARPPIVTLTGTSSHARLSLVILAESGRFKRLTIVSAPAEDAPASTIELSFTSFDPGLVEDWALDIAGRAEVRTIQELPSATRVIAPGEPVPELGLTDLELRSWSWRGHAGGKPVAIVLFRLGAGDSELAITRARHAAEAARSGAASLPIAVVGVIDLAGFDGSTIERLRSLRAPGIEAAWTSSARDSIDRLAPDQQAAVVFVSSGGMLRRVVPIEGEESFSDVLREAESTVK